MVTGALIEPDGPDKVALAKLSQALPDTNLDFQLVGNSGLVPPKAFSQLTFRGTPAAPPLDADQARQAFVDYYSIYLMMAKKLGHDPSEGSLEQLPWQFHPFTMYIHVVESDGTRGDLTVPIGWLEMSHLMKGHAIRCAALREPATAENGCLGAGQSEAKSLKALSRCYESAGQQISSADMFNCAAAAEPKGSKLVANSVGNDQRPSTSQRGVPVTRKKQPKNS